MKNILHVVGARPNFIKAAPVWNAIHELEEINQILVHTGQHYDSIMSDIFFEELSIPQPDYNLNIGSNSHARQTAAIMIKLEDLILKNTPDLVMVYGDVNSTVAAAMVCSKISIPFAHVEAGLRSFDRNMPEEINRIITDQLADLLFTPSEDGDQNLVKEGVDKGKIFFVGNVMIDTLDKLNSKARMPKKFEQLNNYILVTIHRPSNVDDINNLKSILDNLIKVSNTHPVIFPIHPRTKQVLLNSQTKYNYIENLYLIEPLGYLEFLGLMKNAKAVITDSGGIQEETTWLGIPCITIRKNTERPVTIKMGTNQLIGLDYNTIPSVINSLNYERQLNTKPPLWDGSASVRIAGIVKNYLKDKF